MKQALSAGARTGHNRATMQIQTTEQLRRMYGAPTDRVIRKELPHIDQHIERFISLSPFLVMASGDAQHQMDASPRGGTPGFVKVLDQHTLLIPDSPGNKRLDTLQNILSTQQVGLLFLVPGMDEIVRVNGRASLETGEDLLAHFEEMKRKNGLVIKVTVESAYMHCAKAAMRSGLWNADSKQERSVMPSMGQLIKEHAQLEGPAETQEEMLRRYENEL